MQSLPSLAFFLFRKEFNKFKNTGALMLDSMIHRGSYMSAHVLLIFIKQVEEEKR